MNLAALEAVVAATRRKITAGTAVPGDRFYGFYDVTLFDCPPFLMFTANDCPRAIDILIHKSFEPMSMKLWCRLAVQASGIFDIGSQVGVYALAAAGLRPDLQIQAFEPNPYAFSRLRMHKHLNGFENLVENALGLAEKDGTLTMSWDRKPGQPISSGGSLLQGDMSLRETALARTLRLDGMPAAATIGSNGLIKIDVEGTEAMVFHGMRGVISQRPDIIVESFHQVACDFIESITAPLGYQAFLIREDTLTLERMPRLSPAVSTGSNFNRLLTCKSEAQVVEIMSRRAYART